MNASAGDTDSYDVTITNSFGMATSDPALVAVRSNPCTGDLNDDGALNFDDVNAFVAAFQAGCP